MNGIQQPQMLPEPKKKTWLWILIGAVTLLTLLFALYVFYSGPTPEPGGETGEPAGVEDVADIEQELQDISVEGLDTELEDIEKELAQ